MTPIRIKLPSSILEFLVKTLQGWMSNWFQEDTGPKIKLPTFAKIIKFCELKHLGNIREAVPILVFF